MTATKDVFEKCAFFYKGIELNKIKVLRDYGQYLCSVFDSQEKHTATLALHTGSILYQAMAISIATIACLFYQNTDITDLVASLNAGDMLIVDGKRVRFDGIKCLDRSTTEMFCYRCDDKTKLDKKIPLKNISSHSISIYKGDSVCLGGKGIRSTLEHREKFLMSFTKKSDSSKITTEIKNSIAVIADREISEELYRGISVAYNNNKINLSELVTAAYYSENEIYPIGNNLTKEDPILKFYSKISACRDDIIANKQKQILGCIVADENLWLDNSEIVDIADRKSLRSVVLEGKTHYTKYENWMDNEDYKYYVSVPETVAHAINEDEFSYNAKAFKKELQWFATRKINGVSLPCKFDANDIWTIKRSLIKIKNEAYDSEKKDDFVITSYFLLSLVRSAFFPLSYCDKAYQKKLISWNMQELLSKLQSFILDESGSIKSCAENIYDSLMQMIDEMYKSNAKGEWIKEQIIKKNVDCIVTTKAYYDIIFSLWLNDCKIGPSLRPNVITVSAFERNVCGWEKPIFVTGYYDFDFNPYASFGYLSANVLAYDYEQGQIKQLKNSAEHGRSVIHAKNETSYHIECNTEELQNISNENIEDARFESEMDKFVRDLQIKSAYRYFSSSKATGDNVIEIAKVLTFASGNIGFFTKHYKAYRISGADVSEVELENLKTGDSLVFTKEAENKDIVSLLLIQLLEGRYKDTMYPKYYELSMAWKKALKKYMENHGLSYQSVANRLKNMGCEKHQVTIRAWLDEDAHVVGPRDESDYQAIVKLLGMNEPPSNIKKGCDEIRSLRMKILSLLGKAIIRGMFSDDDPLWNAISAKAGDLSQIEQITGISSPDDNYRVPIYMANKPCNI